LNKYDSEKMKILFSYYVVCNGWTAINNDKDMKVSSSTIRKIYMSFQRSTRAS